MTKRKKPVDNQGSAGDFLSKATQLREKMEQEDKEAEDLLDKVLSFFSKLFSGSKK